MEWVRKFIKAFSEGEEGNILTSQEKWLIGLFARWLEDELKKMNVELPKPNGDENEN